MCHCFFTSGFLSRYPTGVLDRKIFLHYLCHCGNYYPTSYVWDADRHPGQPENCSYPHIFPNVLLEDSAKYNPKGTKWTPTSREVPEIPKVLKSWDYLMFSNLCWRSPQDYDLQLSESVTDLAPLAQGLVQSRCEWTKDQDQWWLDALDGSVH